MILMVQHLLEGLRDRKHSKQKEKFGPVELFHIRVFAAFQFAA